MKPLAKYDMRITIAVPEKGIDNIDDLTCVNITLQDVDRAYIEKFPPLSAALHTLEASVNDEVDGGEDV